MSFSWGGGPLTCVMLQISSKGQAPEGGVSCSGGSKTKALMQGRWLAALANVSHKLYNPQRRLGPPSTINMATKLMSCDVQFNSLACSLSRARDFANCMGMGSGLGDYTTTHSFLRSQVHSHVTSMSEWVWGRGATWCFWPSACTH